MPTTEGRIDRHAIPTRRLENPRGLVLQDGKRPKNEAAWLEERADAVKARR